MFKPIYKHLNYIMKLLTLIFGAAVYCASAIKIKPQQIHNDVYELQPEDWKLGTDLSVENH